MRILLVNVVYKKGSTGNIVDILKDEFIKKGNVCKVFYGRGQKLDDLNAKKVTTEFESNFNHLLSLFTGNIYGGMHIATFRLIKEIKRFKPDIVNLHCINGFFVNLYSILNWLAKNKIKTVISMHADFMMTGGCGIADECINHLKYECKNCNRHRTFCSRFSLNRTHHFYCKLKKCISNFDNKLLKITCVSPWLQKRYLESPIYYGKEILCIYNPVSNLFFNDCKLNPYDKKNNILYVTRDLSDEIKSGRFLDEIASKKPDVNFTVISALNNNFNFKSSNVKYIKGGLNQDQLHDYYSFADETLLLSKRETFSMIVAESLASGTPVIGFKCGGPETIFNKKHAKFYEYNNIDELCSNILKNDVIKTEVREAAFKSFGADVVSDLYLKLYGAMK